MMGIPTPERTCPMCGGSNLAGWPAQDRNIYILECNGCGLRVDGENHLIAMEKWNTRASDATQAEINRLLRIITYAREELLENNPFHAFRSLDREVEKFGP